MSSEISTLDVVHIGSGQLVLISENRISFVRDVSENEIDDICAEEQRIIAADIKASTAPTPLGPSIAFMPTFDCNLRCIYCYAKGGEDKTKLSITTAMHAVDWIISKVDDLATTPLTIYFVGGGEPFMNFKIMDEICNYARQHFNGIEIVIVSNGVYGQKQRQWLIDNKASTRISFDGVMQAQNRPLATHMPSETTVKQTIKELVAADVPLTIQLTITRDGTARMIESVKQIVSLGARYIKIEPVHNSVLSRGEWSLVPDLEEFVERFILTLKWIVKHNLPVKIDNSFVSRPTSGYYCGTGEGSNITVTPTGLITSCLEVVRIDDAYADTMIYGHCKEDGHVVIDSTKRQFLSQLHWRNYPNCPDCNLKLICGGGCPMQGGWDNDNLLNPSIYTCRAHQMILPKIFALAFEDPRIIDVVFDGHAIEKC